MAIGVKPRRLRRLASSSFRHWCCVQRVFVRPTRIVFSVTCVIARIVVAAAITCPAQNPHIDVHGRPLRRHSQLRSQPDLQLHVMRWSNDSGAGSLIVGSGVRRPSFSLHPQSVRFKATPFHCCTWWYTRNEC